MTDLERGPSSDGESARFTSSLNNSPEQSSSTLVERLQSRLQRDRRGNFDPELSIKIGPGIYEEIMDAATEIERLRREVELLGKMAAPPDLVAFVESTHRIQEAADEFRKRALTAESALSRIQSETVEAAKIFLAAWDSLPPGHYSPAKIQEWLSSDRMKEGVIAIRSLKLPDYRSGEAKTAESGNCPSTQNAETE